MRKYFYVCAALLTAALTGCQKDLVDPNETARSISFSMEEAATRTEFTTPAGTSYPVLWQSSDQVVVFPNTFSGKKTSGITVSSDRKTAKFNVTFNFTSAAAASSFSLLSPSSALADVGSSGHVADITVPETQTPKAKSPDAAAQILVAKAGPFKKVPTSVTFTPDHLTAYIKLTLTNISGIGTLKGVKLTAAKPLSGTASYDFDEKTVTPIRNQVSSSVQATASKSSQTEFWFATLPAQVAGTTLTVDGIFAGKGGTINTVTRKITVPSGKNLESGKIAVLSVDMNPSVAVTGVTVSPSTLTLEVGKTSTLTATVTPSNATNKTVTWSSSNTSVATVSSAGVVTGVAAGSATITATTQDGGKKATCAVTVKAASVAVTGVTLNKTSLSLGVGKTSTLTATVVPSNATDKSVTWSSSNTSIATVSSAGVVKGVKAGSATITVKTNDGGYTATCAVSVHKTPTKVEIKNKEVGYDLRFDLDDEVYHTSVGQNNAIPYTVYYSDGTSDYCLNGTPSVHTGSGVTVSGTTMTCTAAGKSATIRITADYDASVYDEMLVQTWEPATSIELKDGDGNGDVLENWVKTGTYKYVAAVVSPSTARQKVLVRSQNNDNWSILQQSALRLRLRAPTIADNKDNYSEFRNNSLTLTVTTGAGDLFVSKTYNVTNLDLKEPKPLDWICYNSSTKKFKILDGGMRLYWSGTANVYVETPTLSVPSGYAVVGVVSKNYEFSSPPGTYCSSEYPKVEKIDGKMMSSGVFHGYAIALHNASEGCIWSTDHDNVDGNENWISDLGKSTAVDSQNFSYNALGMTVASYYYNYCRGSSHDIRPVFAIQDYWTRYPLNTYHMSIPSIDWGADFGSWVVPTESLFWPLLAGTTLSDSQMFTLFNARIASANGTKMVADNLGYWTIQQYNADEAAMIWAGGLDRRNKNGTCRVRPFLVF